MSRITHKNLYTLLVDEIEKRGAFNTRNSYSNQQSRDGISPFALHASSGTADVNVAALVTAIQTLLEEALPGNILEGLEVTATDPETNYVNISAGKGTVGGRVYTLEEDTTVSVPIPSAEHLYYIVLYEDRIMVEQTESSSKLTLAKIIIPQPNITAAIRDTKDDSYDGYIIQNRIYYLYGDGNGKFEENTVELLKDNIGDILAETIIGTLTLNDNLKITNIASSLELDSDSLKIKNASNNILAKMNKNGLYFYNNAGVELAKFANNEARIGNILITQNSIESDNFLSGSVGFQIKDNGDVEFSDATLRGLIYASGGTIGGFTITETELYGGTIKTAETVAAGSNGVIMDSNGLRGYDSLLGLVFNLPTDGSSPLFSSGIIQETIFEIQTNAILRTSETVGDGSSNSAGLLINNTGLYGCEANQTLVDANLKALIDGQIILKGTIYAASGQIGSVSIGSTKLSGGLIEGAVLRASVIETQETLPKIRLDETGFYYQVTTNVGKYGESGSGSYGFQYGDGTFYGAGVLAYLFNENHPIFSIMAEHDYADIHLYNRVAAPSAGSGPHTIGDIIAVSGKLKICTSGGSPGTFSDVGLNKLSDLEDCSLDDPDADRIVFWDDSDGQFEHLIPGDGIEIVTNNLQIDYNTTNLKITSNELDTIQSIATSASPTFEGLNIGDEGSITESSDDIYIKALIQDKDIIFQVNDGGANTEVFRLDGDVSQLKLAQHMNFNQKQGIAFVVENRTSDPASPVAGQMWIRTDV